MNKRSKRVIQLGGLGDGALASGKICKPEHCQSFDIAFLVIGKRLISKAVRVKTNGDS